MQHRRTGVWALAPALVLMSMGCQPGDEQAGAAATAATPGARTEGAGSPVDGDQQEVLEAHANLIQALQSGNTDAAVALLDTRETLVLFHPMLTDRYASVEELRPDLERMRQHLPEATWTDTHAEVVVSGDLAWVTSHLAIESRSLKEPFVGRATEVWSRSGDGWRLVHGHWSEQPPERAQGQGARPTGAAQPRE